MITIQINLKKLNKYNHPTIPVVIMQDNKEIFIGGCDDTIEHLKGKLNDTGET